MTNRERIMEELLKLPDRDFAIALDEAICPTCEDCPQSLHMVCRDDNNITCFMEIVDWLNYNYNSDDKNLIKILF